MKTIPKERSFLVQGLYNILERRSSRDRSLRRYDPEIRRQAIENVLGLVGDSFDEALRADGLNITGSVLKTVSRTARKRKDGTKEKDDDSTWTDEEKERWEKADRNARTWGTISGLYDTADAFGLLTRDETIAYNAILSLAQEYGESRGLRGIEIASHVYRFGTQWLGLGAAITDRVRNGIKGKKPWENQGKSWLDVAYAITSGTDKVLEYIPFWTGVLYLAIRESVKSEAEKLSRSGAYA